MNLQELHEGKKVVLVSRALREHYNLNIDFQVMDLKQTQRMLTKVRGLLKEARTGKSAHSNHDSAAYLKLVMLEQALDERSMELQRGVRIVVENEDVQEAQVLLAAQDLIDSVQKMLEQVSKMNVEELNAVAQGIKNEFGEEKGTQYSQAAGGALSTLQQALQAAKTELESAQSGITGTGMPEVEPASGPEMGAEMGAGMGAEMGQEQPDMGAEPGMDEEPAEEPDLSGAGRERR